MKNIVLDSLLESQVVLNKMVSDGHFISTLEAAGRALSLAMIKGAHVYSCGNGGSMCDAMHFAEELSGRYRLNRPALGAISISDVGHMTCVSNDFGYEHVFSRFIEGNGRQGDFLLAISTSGTSKSILNAVATAKSKGMTVIGLHGKPGSPLGELSDFNICTPGGRFADRVQECHIKVIHILIELVERQLFPANYAEPV